MTRSPAAAVFRALMRCSAAPWAAGCAAVPAQPAQFTEAIPGTTLNLEMVRVGDLWFSRTEVTWDLYDVFIYGLDRAPDDTGPDAVTRPSKPYISMDRGFGRAGYPAISMSYRGAEAFCAWLSLKTGRRYRLPTGSEWRAACALGGVPEAEKDRFAWHRGNAGSKTHPVATSRADASGLFDMAGNAAEWCTGDNGEPLVLGGCYRDAAEGVGCGASARPSKDWNRSDPQIPKSVWWLADGGFVGFRVVCETDPRP